jgi:hypothetical protein
MDRTNRFYGLIHRNSKGEVHIGSNKGKIAVWLNESEAIDMAHTYGPSDRFYDELMYAVSLAYPQVEDESNGE